MNIPSRFFTGLLAICFSYWLTPVIDAGAAGLKQAEITRIYNTVEVVSSGGATKIASVNEKVRGDQAVRTGVQSRAELLFGDQTLTRLGANTYFSFSNGTRDMELNSGTMMLQVPKDAGGAQIRTAAVTAAVTGTTVLVETGGTGTNAYAKYVVIEGTMRIFLKDRMGESILLQPGQMIILPQNAVRLPNPVNVDLKRLLRTSRLMRGFKSTENDEQIVQAVVDQEKKKEEGVLVDTNVLLLGRGTLVLFANHELLELLDTRYEQGENRASELLTIRSGGSAGQNPSSGDATDEMPVVGFKGGLPPTISSPNPYRITSGTQIITDPFIITNGVVDVGTMIAPGEFTPSALFNTASGMDDLLGFNSLNIFGDTYAAFKFNALEIAGTPSVNTVGGPVRLALIALNGIEVTGTFDLRNTGLTHVALFNENARLQIAPNASIIFGSGQTVSLYSRSTTNGYLTIAGVVSGPSDSNLDLLSGHSLYVESGARASTGNLNATANNGISIAGTVEAVTAQFRALNGSIFHDTTSVFSGGTHSHSGSSINLQGLYNNLAALNATSTGSLTFSPRSGSFAGSYSLTSGGNLFVTTPVNTNSLTMVVGGTFQQSPGALLSSNTINLSAPNQFFNLNNFQFDTTKTTAITLSVLGLDLPASFTTSGTQITTFNLNLGASGVSAPGQSLDSFNTINVTGGNVALQSLSTRTLTSTTGTVSIPSLFADNLNIGGDYFGNLLQPLGTAGNYVVLGDMNFSTASSGEGIFLNGGSLKAGSIEYGSGQVTAGSISIVGSPLFSAITGDGDINTGSLSVSGFVETGSGDLNVSGSAFVSDYIASNTIRFGFSGGTLQADNSISASYIRPMASSTGPYIIQSASISAAGGMLGPGIDFTSAPGVNAPTLTLTSVKFFIDSDEGGINNISVRSGNNPTGLAGNGGTVILSATLTPGFESSNSIDIAPGANIDVSPGSGNVASGEGGRIRLVANGDINMDGVLRVSRAEPTPSPVTRSTKGGTIEIETLNFGSINIGSTAQLESLLDAAAPVSQGGRIFVRAEQGQIVIASSNVKAEKGTIEVRADSYAGSPGDPSVLIASTAQLRANIVKIGALGVDGVLNIQANAVLSGDQQVTLYGGSGAGGQILFSGSGAVTVSSPLAIMRANAITVSNTTSVNVGTGGVGDVLRVYANTRNIGGAFGNMNLNGTPINATTAGGPFTPGTGQYFIGNYNDGAGFPFNP